MHAQSVAPSLKIGAWTAPPLKSHLAVLTPYHILLSLVVSQSRRHHVVRLCLVVRLSVPALHFASGIGSVNLKREHGSVATKLFAAVHVLSDLDHYP